MDSHNILIVDDEVGVLNALDLTFKDEYNVFPAANGENAWSIMEENDISLVISDHSMPGMTGVELMKKISQKYPDTIRMLITGYTEENLLMDAINTGHIYSFISKPWDVQEVRDTVKEGIKSYERTHASREPHIRTLLDAEIISSEQLETALQVKRAERKPLGQILAEHGVISSSQLDEAMKLRREERKELTQVLMERGFISSNDLEMAREQQEHEGRGLVNILVDLGYADEESVFSCYAFRLGIPYIPLSQFPSRPELAELLPMELAHKYTIVPIDKAGNILVVAASEPLNDKARDEIEEKTGYKVTVVSDKYQDVKLAMEKCYPDLLWSTEGHHSMDHLS